MLSAKFFKKGTLSISSKIKAGGPSFADQILAITQDRYWTVLNTTLLRKDCHDSELPNRVNAFKHALQTYGPMSTNLPDLRQNKGKAQGAVFHGHVHNSTGTTYVLEWAIVDSKNRVMALVGFDTHENYTFRQKPLHQDDCDKMLSNVDNKKIIEHASTKIAEAKNKVERMQLNYRNNL